MGIREWAAKAGNQAAAAAAAPPPVPPASIYGPSAPSLYPSQMYGLFQPPARLQASGFPSYIPPDAYTPRPVLYPNVSGPMPPPWSMAGNMMANVSRNWLRHAPPTPMPTGGGGMMGHTAIFPGDIQSQLPPELARFAYGGGASKGGGLPKRLRTDALTGVAWDWRNRMPSPTIPRGLGAY